MDAAPLIVTLTLDARAQAHFDGLRRAYFPADRYFVGAHVTLFHAIPAVCETRLLKAASLLCAGAAPFAISVTSLRFLGRGVAYALGPSRADEIRAALAREFADHLTAQDGARWNPHITIQNKVTAQRARETLAILSSLPPVADATAMGLAVWRYEGGPWSEIAALPFKRTIP